MKPCSLEYITHKGIKTNINISLKKFKDPAAMRAERAGQGLKMKMRPSGEKELSLSFFASSVRGSTELRPFEWNQGEELYKVVNRILFPKFRAKIKANLHSQRSIICLKLSLIIYIKKYD